MTGVTYVQAFAKAILWKLQVVFKVLELTGRDDTGKLKTCFCLHEPYQLIRDLIKIKGCFRLHLSFCSIFRNIDRHYCTQIFVRIVFLKDLFYINGYLNPYFY